MHNLNFWHQLEPKDLSHGFLLYHVLTQDSLRQLKTLQLREEQFCMITRLKLCHLLQIIPVYVKIPLQLQTFRSQTSSVFFFFQHLILSKSSPLGKVTCYFQRTEFQLRGSPHTHIALWVENAPPLDTATEDEINDNYVTCALPPEDHPLYEHVNEKQRHSHSVACKKHSNNCRFHYL